MQIVGLILDILGAIILFIGTEILNKSLLLIIENIQNFTGIGTTAFQATQLQLLELKKKKARIYTGIGLTLIILGFVFQLIGYL